MFSAPPSGTLPLRYYNQVPSFYVENFGCRATQADGAAITRQFEELGYSPIATPHQAEIVILNTCTVTAAADRDARAAIRRVHRDNPNCQIVVTGCYAQRAPDEIAALPGVARVVGNSHKHELAHLSVTAPAMAASAPSQAPGFFPLERLAKPPVHVSDIFAHTELAAAPVFDSAHERVRPNLKVQDGCNNRCSFCVIPSVRGRSRSLPLPEVLREVNALCAAGYREVVISGINLGRWGRDFSTTDSGRAPRLVHLIRAILDHTPLEKLRVSSVEPMDWTDELISLMASSPRIAKHAHVPMQSGSDAVLRRMHRKYRPWHYRDRVEKIRAAAPAAAIGADVMVGFPGETDEEFEQTWRNIRDLPLTYLHVFTYSARPGTPAAELAVQVPVETARARNRILRELASEKKQDFMKSFIGRQVEAITLHAGNQEFTEALTDNYLKLRLQGSHAPNRWLRAGVEGVDSGLLVGASLQ